MSLDYEIYKEGGILNNRYQKIEDISEGSYGYVSLAKDTKSKRLVAVKYIFKLEGEEDEYDDRRIEEVDNDREMTKNSSVEKKSNLLNKKKSMISSKIRSRFSNNICLEAMYEVDIQTKIGVHENIVQLYDYFDSYIIMEYCAGGDLYEAIKDDLVPKKTKEITHILTQILDAIEFVHEKQIFHRDIKPENILISSLIDWKIKLTDWGLATTDITSYDRNVGSERYMPPELFESNLDIDERKDPYNCSKVDLWSIGIVFLNVVFYKNPFRIADQSDKSFCYFAANREALFDVFSTMTYDFFQVLRYSLTIDPANRDIHKIRTELNNLSQYTLDDNFYNNDMDVEEEEDEIEDIFDKAQQPPSSAPVSLPTPVSSSKPLPKIQNDFTFVQPDDKPLERPKDDPKSPISMENNYLHPDKYANNVPDHTAHENPSHPAAKDNEDIRERAKSVPKFRFQKRSKKPLKQHNNGNNYQNTHGGTRAIRIENRRKSRIIKHSRKPLGIPTPNTHLNNYMNEYESKKEDFFHTRQYFTPPSVQNRYMEGIFNKSHNGKYQNKQNNKYWNSKYFSHHNGQHQNGKSNSKRRPSSSGINYGNQKMVFPRFIHNSNLHQNAGRRHSAHTIQHIPGTYLPPNARHDSKNNANGNQRYNPTHVLPMTSHSNDVPDISTVLDSHGTNGKDEMGNMAAQAYRQHIYKEDDRFGPHDNTYDVDHGHDSDDILFSLDETEHENSFVHDMEGLSLNDNQSGNGHALHGSDAFFRTEIAPSLANHSIHNGVSTRTSTPSSTRSRNSNGTNELPDLLKSPVISQTPINGGSVCTSKPSINVNGNPLLEPVKHLPNGNSTIAAVKVPTLETPSQQAQDRQFKSGVYIPPHQRRSFNLGAGTGFHQRANANEATLSVSHNSIQYGGSYKNRRGSMPASAFGNNNNRRFTAGNPAQRPVVLQHNIYDNMDNDALEFEDDEPQHAQFRSKSRNRHGYQHGITNSSTPEEKSMFGPYDIYTKSNNHNKNSTGRKSSVIQEDLVGSLEQYKNYWLMLQQQQE
ncbi:cAMP-dependent protein kinase type 2 [Nakaseomyces bracarensis]|uniref:non-specific serine/threonine protein kinase n=1 Tax=Nakaseomyces bracarensis TaxID=273131 RepID=A0ABR4NTT6_9SACH